MSQLDSPLRIRDHPAREGHASTFRRERRGEIFRVAKAGFGPGDPFAGLWHLFALLRDGAGDWKPKYRY